MTVTIVRCADIFLTTCNDICATENIRQENILGFPLELGLLKHCNCTHGANKWVERSDQRTGLEENQDHRHHYYDHHRRNNQLYNTETNIWSHWMVSWHLTNNSGYGHSPKMSLWVGQGRQSLHPGRQEGGHEVITVVEGWRVSVLEVGRGGLSWEIWRLTILNVALNLKPLTAFNAACSSKPAVDVALPLQCLPLPLFAIAIANVNALFAILLLVALLSLQWHPL